MSFTDVSGSLFKVESTWKAFSSDSFDFHGKQQRKKTLTISMAAAYSNKQIGIVPVVVYEFATMMGSRPMMTKNLRKRNSFKERGGE